MRKIFLAVSIVFASFGFVFSQGFVGPPCVIYPAEDTFNFFEYPQADSFPCIDSGIPFYDAFQISMPSTIDGIISIDSLVISSITGIPAGMGYSINPSSQVFYADSNGCVAFSGTTNEPSGFYPITFNGYAVVTSPTTGTHTYSLEQLAEIEGAPVPSYVLSVINAEDTCNPQAYTSVPLINASRYFNVYPNPSNGVFQLELEDVKNLNPEIFVTDLTGRTVFCEFSVAGLSNTSIDLNGCSKGMYLLYLRTTEGIVSKKISID